MTNRFTAPAFTVCLIALMLAGCVSTERTSNQNLAFIYDRGSDELRPEFRIRHENDTVSLLEFRISSKDLLYLQHPESGYYSAEFRMRYEVYGQVESRVLVDSAVVMFKDSILKPENRSIEGALQLKPSHSATGVLKIDLVDLKRNARSISYIGIDRSEADCRQFFSVSEAKDGIPLFRNHISAKEEVLIAHSSGAVQAKVSLYAQEMPLPLPPFSMGEARPFNYTPDSVFTITLGRPVSFPREGMYHIQLNDSTRQGLTLIRFRDGFPKVKEVDDLIAPLRYINSSQEFKKLTSADFPKAEVDRFWLALAGNAERARILIEKFYSRVQDANTHFTSFTEGWRSDRGLVYIIYGPPEVLYKNSNAEQWTYGDPNSPRSVTFVFRRVNNPFSDNDFRLERSQMYKSDWFRAVDQWRQGRIYLGN
ncbi:MAG: GWxTD domain-containing protein [Flavobacteriales bacterium]|nr:GWxTD domain-containing protein [Flavobacteriales bacterium]